MIKKFTLVRITTVPISFIGLLKGQLCFMSSYFDVHAISSPGDSLAKVEENENALVHEVKMEREPSPVYDLRSLFRLYSVLKRIKPQIVHTHTPKAGLLGMAASFFLRVPVRLHTVAGIPWMESTGVKRKVLIQVEKITYFFATHVYSNSKELQKFILTNNLINSSKLTVIANGSSNGVNTDFYDRTPELVDEVKNLKSEFNFGDERVIVFVGRLVKDKGIEELLEVYRRISANQEIKLLLVGPFEPERDPLTESAMELIITNPNIVTTGFVNDVRPYLMLGDFLAFPSYREGFPNVPMQAGALGIPCIATDINGCNEIIVDGVNGIIIPPKDTEALYEAANQLLNDEELLSTLAANSRRLIVERYDQKLVWKNLLSEYRSHIEHAGL